MRIIVSDLLAGLDTAAPARVAPDLQLTLRSITAVLPRFSYRYASEVHLHDAIAGVLTQHGIQHEREVIAGPHDRFDFLVPPGIVIEVKCDGSWPQALRQCDRYAARDNVRAVVLATTRRPGQQLPGLRGKPFHQVQLRGMSF